MDSELFFSLFFPELMFANQTLETWWQLEIVIKTATVIRSSPRTSETMHSQIRIGPRIFAQDLRYEELSC